MVYPSSVAAPVTGSRFCPSGQYNQVDSSN
jgi:hypothetical protein